jgi:hypothetical protein
MLNVGRSGGAGTLFIKSLANLLRQMIEGGKELILAN